MIFFIFLLTLGVATVSMLRTQTASFTELLMRTTVGRLPQFWEYVVEESEPRMVGSSVCWLWIGSRGGKYPRFSTVAAHSAAAAIYCREAPSKVTHRCGNLLCVNENHLIISLLKNKPDKRSGFTGDKLKTPVTQNPDTIKTVLDMRMIDHSSLNRRKQRRQNSTVLDMANRANVSVLTVRRILKKAPIYDLISEIGVILKAGGTHQRRPHLREAELREAELSGSLRSMFESAVRYSKQTGVTSETQAI